MIPLLTPPPRRWECPNCNLQEITSWDTPNRYHPCRGLAGLSAPMVIAGGKCAVVAKEREDYIGGEDVQLDGEGRPIMSVVTERPDGSNDVVVYAPTARGEVGI